MTLHVEPFTIAVADDVLADLLARLRNVRLPPPAPGPLWEQGTDRDALERLLRHWTDRFDWRTVETKLNRFHHFRASMDGIPIHFVHERSRRGAGIPLILTHGWPSAFIEYLALVPLLTDPQAHDIDGPAFDVVIPSLPGYLFSGRPVPTNYRTVASLWHRLMRGLGYQRYGAAGGDFGAGVSTFMALDDPDAMLGIHLSTQELSPVIEDETSLSPAERAYLTQRGKWDAVERGYSAIQSTRPQTLGYGLTDSPAGLAAWILEKWRAWSDCGGELERRFPAEFLLTLVTLYWVTGSITTSMRDYFDNRWHGVPIRSTDFVRVPTGIASFTRQFAFEGEPPREYVERLYRVTRFTPMPSGGHFAAAEEPVALAREIAAFFAAL